jgi:glutaredoxin
MAAKKDNKTVITAKVTRTAKTTKAKKATKVSRKAAKPEKRIARTAGLNAVGQCGHPFAARISLWPISGEPVNEGTLTSRAQLISGAVETFKLAGCPDCVAAERLTEAAEEEKAILEGFGLPALPELQGSLRQKAWGHQERASTLIGLVADQMWHSASPQLANDFFNQILASRFGDSPSEFGPEFKPVFDGMRSMIHSSVLPYFWSSRAPEPSEKDLVASWILVQYAFNRSHVLKENSARMWILRSKSRSQGRRMGSYPPDANLLLATKMVVNTPGWESPEKMFHAVDQLLSWSNETDRSLVSGMGDLSLPDTLEQIAVVRALSPREADFPF